MKGMKGMGMLEMGVGSSSVVEDAGLSSDHL
jgi:hypothetical protein